MLRRCRPGHRLTSLLVNRLELELSSLRNATCLCWTSTVLPQVCSSNNGQNFTIVASDFSMPVTISTTCHRHAYAEHTKHSHEGSVKRCLEVRPPISRSFNIVGLTTWITPKHLGFCLYLPTLVRKTYHQHSKPVNDHNKARPPHFDKHTKSSPSMSHGA